MCVCTVDRAGGCEGMGARMAVGRESALAGWIGATQDLGEVFDPALFARRIGAFGALGDRDDESALLEGDEGVVGRAVVAGEGDVRAVAGAAEVGDDAAVAGRAAGGELCAVGAP